MNKTLIIAEAGVNHNGSLELAKKLIKCAADAHVDIVKFQTFKTENLVSALAKKADYQKANMDEKNSSQFDMLKKLELSEADHIELKKYAEQCGIEFWSTAFDNESIALLIRLGIQRWKIPSGEITNLPYLKKIGSLGNEVILSTGMCTIKEIEEAMNVLIAAGTSKKNIHVLHCNTEYPTPMKDVNLHAMCSLKKILQINVGYSDHTKGIEIPIAAVALGATIIEKHFTLDRTMEGPDHRASLEPQELKAMVSAIRNIEIAMGSGVKKPSPSEIKNIAIARKSIHLNKSLQKDNIISEEDLTMLRPGDGISPMEMNSVIGKKIKKDLKKGHKLEYADFI